MASEHRRALAVIGGPLSSQADATPDLPQHIEHGSQDAHVQRPDRVQLSPERGMFKPLATGHLTGVAFDSRATCGLPGRRDGQGWTHHPLVGPRRLGGGDAALPIANRFLDRKFCANPIRSPRFRCGKQSSLPSLWLPSWDC
jgi:hypothetical protein